MYFDILLLNMLFTDFTGRATDPTRVTNGSHINKLKAQCIVKYNVQFPYYHNITFIQN